SRRRHTSWQRDWSSAVCSSDLRVQSAPEVMNPLMADPAFGFIPTQFVGSIQSVPGLTDFGGGLNALRPGTRANGRNVFWNSFQWADDISLIKGAHALQFGALVERMQDNSLLSGQHNGSFKFSSLPD